jgi:hypothetical protein
MHVACTYTTLTVPTDDDWFSFTLTAPGQVHLHGSAGGTLVQGFSRDNRIAIYDATGTTRLAWNDGSVGTMADCGVTLPAGSYMAVVNLKTTVTGTPTNFEYGLDFYVLPPRTIDTLEGPEPNDGTGTPTPFTLGQTVEGDLSTTADVDYWSFTLANPGIVQAVSYDDGGVPQLDNLALRFYQETTPGNWFPLGTGNATNSASHRVTTLTHTGLLAAGTYAVGVQAGTNAAGTVPWDYVRTGKYSLRTCLIDMGGAVSTTEGPEPNDNSVTPAGNLGLGDAASGNISGSNEADWYLIAVGGPTTIGAMAEGNLAGTPLLGSGLRLYDANSTLVTSASGGASTHARMIYTIERAGIYYLAVYGAVVASAGDYILHSGACSPVYVSATTRIEPASTNACIGSNGLRPLLGYLSGETPAFGSTFITRVERALPSAPVGVFLGFSNTVAFGSVPLPAFLDFGGLDSQSNPTTCDVRVDPLAFVGVATDANGYGEYSINFPFALGDFGLKVYQQAACYDPTLNSFQVSLSNDANYVLGDRPF